MARLTAAQRKNLKSSSFAGPNRSFPMQDKAHARAALSLQRYASPATKKKIKARAKAMGIGVAGEKTPARAGSSGKPKAAKKTTAKSRGKGKR